MPQRFYFDETDLNGTLEKMNRNLMEMLDFAYIHEDTFATIEELMSDWGKENLPYYSDIIEEYENMEEEQKQWYDDVDDYLTEIRRWWIESFDKLNDEMKKNFIHRYRIDQIPPANVIIAPDISNTKVSSIRPFVTKNPPMNVKECLTIPKNCSLPINFIIY